MRRVRLIALSVLVLAFRAGGISLRRAASRYDTIIKKTCDEKPAGDAPIRGCTQLFHVMSALTTSVLAESRRQPDALARTATTSESARMRSTTARIFVRGGSMTWTYGGKSAPAYTRSSRDGGGGRTSGSGQRGSVSSATSAGFI